MAEDWAGGQRSGRTAAMLLRSVIVAVSNFGVVPTKAGNHAFDNVVS
jgi:hypothetical protein